MEKETSFEIPKAEKKIPETGFPIQAYLRIISDFFTRGYYHETETEYPRSTSGKINWRKTIKMIQSELVDDNLLFLSYITRKSLNNENELITQIHKYFVYEAFFKLGSYSVLSCQ